jgi:D-serine deaminase-like pyridoxal phosphate-dependent protein
MEDPWYVIERVNELDTPTLIIYLERVKQNIQKAIEIIGDVNRLRPHIKTHKSKEISLLLKKAGIKKFKCATIAEADILGMIQPVDVLLAYQPTGPKIDRLISLIKDYTHTKYSCLVDSKYAADEISDKAVHNYMQIPVFIDINVGMNRTGISTEKALELFDYCATLKGIQPIGLHAYDGHINMADFEERKSACIAAIKPVEKLKQELQRKGYKNSTIVAGGSPSFPIHAKNGNVEVSPGTFIFWDAGYMEKLKEQPFVPAALVLSRIISLPSEGLICTDLGHKSVAAENIVSRRVYFINALDAEPLSQSEEHLVLKVPVNHNYTVGDLLYGIPYHICPTVALFERASIAENKRIISEWEISARNRRILH